MLSPRDCNQQAHEALKEPPHRISPEAAWRGFKSETAINEPTEPPIVGSAPTFRRTR
eukprot:m.349518 g.349518  ORF g.349518 m.349518 type:complete len:57 (+) comp55884_c0_seq6:940-1110(+)